MSTIYQTTINPETLKLESSPVSIGRCRSDVPARIKDNPFNKSFEWFFKPKRRALKLDKYVKAGGIVPEYVIDRNPDLREQNEKNKEAEGRWRDAKIK